MSTFYLIRHGLNDFVGQAVAGWLPGVHLNEEGRAQAGRLARVLAGRGITRIVSSPLERARETAEPLSIALNLQVETDGAFGEVRYGEWTGRSFAELERDSHWRLFNAYRSGTRAPGGETMLDSQARFVAAIERLQIRYPGETIAVTSHADIIRAALVYYMGMPLDLYHRLTIQPASYSVVTLNGSAPRIVCLNAAAE